MGDIQQRLSMDLTAPKSQPLVSDLRNARPFGLAKCYAGYISWRSSVAFYRMSTISLQNER